jgi:hypothetical protein
MKWKHTSLLLALLVLVGVLAAGGMVLRNTAPALAQTSTSYNLEWHVIGGGGLAVSSAHYVVNSTAGQGAASPPYSASGNYVVSGGYWFRQTYRSYLPLIFRNY